MLYQQVLLSFNLVDPFDLDFSQIPVDSKVRRKATIAKSKSHLGDLNILYVLYQQVLALEACLLSNISAPGQTLAQLVKVSFYVIIE